MSDFSVRPEHVYDEDETFRVEFRENAQYYDISVVRKQDDEVVADYPQAMPNPQLEYVRVYNAEYYIEQAHAAEKDRSEPGWREEEGARAQAEREAEDQADLDVSEGHEQFDATERFDSEQSLEVEHEVVRAEPEEDQS